MSELYYRVLYLPSLGFCLLVVIGAKRISQHIGNKVSISLYSNDSNWFVLLIENYTNDYGIHTANNVSKNSFKKLGMTIKTELNSVCNYIYIYIYRIGGQI